MVAEYFLENLKQLMVSANIGSQLELARRAGIPSSTVGNWYQGKSIPKADNLEELARFFNVEPSYFFMKPGTQGEVNPTQKDGSYTSFIEELAKKHLKEAEYARYSKLGGAEFFLTEMRAICEDNDTVNGEMWYRVLIRELGKYVNFDQDKKFKEVLDRRFPREEIKKKNSESA